MFTSDTNNKTTAIKYTVLFLIISALCLTFSLIYENFSHGVHSDSMMIIFVFPLIAATVYFALQFIKSDFFPHKLTLHVFNAFICTASLDSCIKGVLEIYGTDSPLTVIYDITAVSLVVMFIILYFLQIIKRKIR